MDFRVIDNFLPEDSYQEMKRLLTSQGSPWFYNPRIDTDTEEEIDDVRKFQFFYTFNYMGVWHGNEEVVAPLISKLNPLATLKVKANLQPRSSEKHLNLFHRDLTNYQNPEHVTAVYYINTCDGKTVFDTGEEVESVGNRILLFHGSKLHTGTSVTNAKTRCVVNVNFIQMLSHRWIPPVFDPLAYPAC